MVVMAVMVVMVVMVVIIGMVVIIVMVVMATLLQIAASVHDLFREGRAQGGGEVGTHHMPTSCRLYTHTHM